MREGDHRVFGGEQLLGGVEVDAAVFGERTDVDLPARALVPGELLLDAFELARDIRLLDMQAAPYDLSDWDVVPVPIETAEGKAEYVRRQRVFAERGAVLRTALLRAWLGTEAHADVA
jgi:hypothetical protein